MIAYALHKLVSGVVETVVSLLQLCTCPVEPKLEHNVLPNFHCLDEQVAIEETNEPDSVEQPDLAEKLISCVEITFALTVKCDATNRDG